MFTLHRTLEHEPAVRRAIVYAFVEADELDARAWNSSSGDIEPAERLPRESQGSHRMSP